MEYALEMNSITKKFGSVKALNRVNLNVKNGEIHAICGENGAGKSTLMKIMSGLYSSEEFEGSMKIFGSKCRFRNTKESEQAGIAIIYQELALVGELSVSENIFLGHEISKNYLIDHDLSYKKASKFLDEVKLPVCPSEKVSSLGVGQQQLVEIAKAVAKNARILILDEPTAALNDLEAENLLEIIKNLRNKGTTCIFISHRLKEVFSIADSVTILRDGEIVISESTSFFNEKSLISKMVGREINDIYPKRISRRGKELLSIEGWSVCKPGTDFKVVNNVSFKLYSGECLGISGLMGAGRTELVMSLFAAYGHKISGKLYFNNTLTSFKQESDAIEAGIALVSEDRKKNGLVLNRNIVENTSLASLNKLTHFGLIDSQQEHVAALDYMRKLHIKSPSSKQAVANLSGGNQQKVVLAKWLMTKPKVLILDEPTRGIDVGAKFEIYSIINELLESGVSIIMISSELPEVLGMSDRILVMHEGVIKGELQRDEASQEKVMNLATGNAGDING